MVKSKEKTKADMTTGNAAAGSTAASKKAADTAVAAKVTDNAGERKVTEATTKSGTAAVEEAKERNVVQKGAQEDEPEHPPMTAAVKPKISSKTSDDEMAKAKAKASAGRKPVRAAAAASGNLSVPESKKKNTTAKNNTDDEMAKAKAKASAGRRPVRAAAAPSGPISVPESKKKNTSAKKTTDDEMAKAKAKASAGRRAARAAAAASGPFSVSESKKRNTMAKKTTDDEMAKAKAKASAGRGPAKASVVASGTVVGLQNAYFPPVSESFNNAEGTRKRAPDDEMAKAKARASAGRGPVRSSAVASGTFPVPESKERSTTAKKNPDDEMAKAKARASAGMGAARSYAVASRAAVGLKSAHSPSVSEPLDKEKRMLEDSRKKAPDDEMAKAKAKVSAGRGPVRSSAIASGTSAVLQKASFPSAGEPFDDAKGKLEDTRKRAPDDKMVKARARRPVRASAVASGTFPVPESKERNTSVKKTPDDEMAKAKVRASVGMGAARSSAVASGTAAELQHAYLPSVSEPFDEAEGKCEEDIEGVTQKKIVDEYYEASRPGAFYVPGLEEERSISIWQSSMSLDVSGNEGVASTTDRAIQQKEEHYAMEEVSEHAFKAVVVDEEDLQDSYCRDIIMEAVEAADVVVVNEDEEKTKKMKFFFYWICAVLAALGTIIGLSVGLTMAKDQNTEPPSTVPTVAPTFQLPSASPTLVPTGIMIPTLETIQNNGKVRCGIGYFPNIEADWCRALAAAVLGDPEKIDLVNHTLTTRWEALANESLDVLTMSSTYTMSRDVYQKEAKVGFTFSAPFLYDGLVFAGIPEYVDCADRLDTYFGNCRKVRICVNMGGAFHDVLGDSMPKLSLRPVKVGTLHEMFMKGQCNVLAGNSVVIAESALRKKGYTGDYRMGKTLLLREPLSMVTREDDKKWSDFVNWIFRSLLAAEEQNITNTTASKFMTTTVFGNKYSDMFVNAIQAVGNYGDIYRRHMEDSIPRDNLMSNLLNNGSTGLHFAHPLGKPNESPDPISGSTIHSITKNEGKLRCGIFDRVGFGKEIVSTTGTRWEGMDADYCYALSASLFEGDTDKVVFVNLTNSVDGFQALDSGLVDVVAGVPLTLEADVHEASTGKGYTFSMPYFYGGANGEFVEENVSETPEGALSLATREDDSQWSDFVFWVVSATYRAEKEFITQQTSQEMLGVTVFGPSFVDMHRHAIGAVGNYGEIYSRNIESIAPRQGRNLLNTNPFGPQHWSFFL